MISAKVAALTEGTVKAMFVTKIKERAGGAAGRRRSRRCGRANLPDAGGRAAEGLKKVVQAPKPAEKGSGLGASAVILDQEQVRHDGALSARTLPGYTVWQSFTAGTTGTLVHIDMGFFNKMSGAGELRIYEGGGTSGKVLQTLKVNVVGLEGGVTWNRWSVNVPVVGGRRYTFEFRADGKTMPDPYVVANSGSSDPYPGGRFGVTDPSGSYAMDFDALFRTWVETGAGGKKGAGQSQD